MVILEHRGDPRLEETKRIGRVLRIVQLIASEPRQWPRRRLAREFEVSERMIDNDLQLIRHSLCYELDRVHTGYYFRSAPSVHPLKLSLAETLALALAAQQARDTGSVEPATIAGALARLEGALPAGIIPYLRRVEQGRDVRFSPVGERGRVLAVIQQALAQGRRVAIEYHSASRSDALTERTIAPYHLLPYERSWHVVAHDDLRDAVLMFKVDRIAHCRLTEEAYAIPEDFDVGVYLGATWGVLRGESGEPEDVTLRFSARAAPWVRDDRWHPTQRAEARPDGSLDLSFRCGITDELVRWVLSFGGEVQVVQPQHLRRAVVEHARAVIDAEDGRGT